MSFYPLIDHDSRYRRVWMFPRNIRKIYPWKMRKILHLFLNTIPGDVWTGNQDLQNKFRQLLEEENLLKRPSAPYDPHSGGPRTYLAQLKALGLIFERDSGEFYPTIAGELLLSGEKGLEVMQKLLLRHQYPSAYGNLSQVRIHPALKVKPFLFIMLLIAHPDLNKYLTTKDMMVPLIYGHNHKCLDFCVDKIIRFREVADDTLEGFLHIVDDPETDLYTPRTSWNRNIIKKLEGIHDIANTCKNYMESCLLLKEVYINSRKGYTVDEYAEPVFFEACKEQDKFIDFRGSEEAFQRVFGCIGRQKDTRTFPQIGYTPVQLDEKIILTEFFALSGEKLITAAVLDEFTEDILRKYGIAKERTEKVIFPYLKDALSHYETTFLELARAGSKGAINFEKTLTELFSERLRFEARHTGQLKRPKGANGGYADVFIVAMDRKHCALLDAKSSSAYQLSSKDYLAMLHNYIPNYCELTGEREMELEFCSYVAYDFSSGVNAKLESMNREISGEPSVAAIKARDLIEISKKEFNLEKQESFRKLFHKRRILSREDFKNANLL